MADLFAVLAEPSRRLILDALRTGDGLVVRELTATLGLSQPNVSKHLRVLREAGLVTETVEGQSRRYRLRPDGLREVESWLEPYRRFWARGLDALGHHLDTNPAPTEEET